MTRSSPSPVIAMPTIPKRNSLLTFGLKPLLPRRLKKLQEHLMKLREDLSGEIHQLTAEASEENPNYSMHMADAATDHFDRDLVLGLASFEQEGLYEVDAALRRIEEGTYGICELTGKKIPWERLEALPWTRYSLEAEMQLERNSGYSRAHLGAFRKLHSGDEEWSGERTPEDGPGDWDLPQIAFDPDGAELAHDR